MLKFVKNRISCSISPDSKFGTGFLTTHLLSEKVEIEGVMKEEEEPYKKINILLHRSGETINEIIDSDESYDEYSADDFNTVFRYNLDENGVKVAERGLNDLHISLCYSLVFLPEIKRLNT